MICFLSFCALSLHLLVVSLDHLSQVRDSEYESAATSLGNVRATWRRYFAEFRGVLACEVEVAKFSLRGSSLSLSSKVVSREVRATLLSRYQLRLVRSSLTVSASAEV